MKSIQWVLITYLCSASYVFAIDNLTLKLGSIVGTGWQAEEVSAQLQWLNQNNLRLSVAIASVTLPALKKSITDLNLHCQQTTYNVDKISCPQANLSIGGNLLDKSPFNLSFVYDFNSQQLDLNVDELALAGGFMTLQAQLAPNGWQAQLNFKHFELESLLTQISSLIDLPFDYTFGGKTSLQMTLAGDAEIHSMLLTGQTNNFSFSDVEGTQVGENLNGKIALNVRNISNTQEIKTLTLLKEMDEAQTKNSFQIQGTLTVNRGEVYIEPIYLEVTEKQPVTIAIDSIGQLQNINVHHFTYTHANIVTFQGALELAEIEDEWTLQLLSLQLGQTELKPFYLHYLQTWWQNEENVLGDLEVSGAIKAIVDWNPDNFHWLVHTYSVNLEDRQQRFGIKGLHGKIQQHSHVTTLPSHLHWRSAYFAPAIQLGTSQIRFNWHGGQIKLLAPWYQPIFDGALRIEQFGLENLGTDNMAWQLHGQLYPISLQTLMTASEGPPLSGTIAGEIPAISYEDNHLKIEGELKIRVFDGNIVARHLHLENPFGDLPKLQADIDITRINLKTLTNTIEFGEIQGQLSGYVHKLSLINWYPVSFEAHFATPQNDPMPHKISQKAIENLTDLGGGTAVDAITQGILNFFKNFSYQQIGWGCRLQNNICQMTGVGPIGKGYYIIKGGGLPRIDMIGYNQTVDWKELITRLNRITNISTDFDNAIIE
jgi:hypothetical protein